jgi:riboflavin kinase
MAGEERLVPPLDAQWKCWDRSFAAERAESWMPRYVGKVVSGMGSFSFWIEKLQDHYLRKTGMHLYPGTLNVELNEAYSLPEKVMRLEGQEYGGTVSVNLLPCAIGGRRAFILRTDLNESGRGPHPKTIVEIATDVRLRDVLGLRDGDLVEVEIADGWEPEAS